MIPMTTRVPTTVRNLDGDQYAQSLHRFVKDNTLAECQVDGNVVTILPGQDCTTGEYKFFSFSNDIRVRISACEAEVVFHARFSIATMIRHSGFTYCIFFINIGVLWLMFDGGPEPQTRLKILIFFPLFVTLYAVPFYFLALMPGLKKIFGLSVANATQKPLPPGDIAEL